MSERRQTDRDTTIADMIDRRSAPVFHVSISDLNGHRYGTKRFTNVSDALATTAMHMSGDAKSVSIERILDTIPVQIRHGFFAYADGDGGGTWYALLPNLPDRDDDDILDLLERSMTDFDREGFRCHTHDGDCCGRMFACGARVRRSPSRILVTQQYGRDI